MLSLHAERLADIVLEQPELDVPANTAISNLDPCIELVNVSFRYGEGEPWILRNINLTIEPHEAIAVTGPSGCGKTTLMKLILGVFAPVEGEIRYGGRSIQQIGVRAYRENIAAVMQEDHLLAGSLRENICFFDARESQNRLETCAKLAAIHDEIVQMPMGYQTLVGDMGTTLSGGQKQRTLLARALYKQPKILILDEATSHLDVERERQVNESIRELPLTRISVAHRPETIAMAARVIRLDKGVIVQDFRQFGVGAETGSFPLQTDGGEKISRMK